MKRSGETAARCALMMVVVCGWMAAGCKAASEPMTKGATATILFTNDTHAHVDDGNVTFSQIAAYRDELAAQAKNPILVDCGDVVQGTAFAKVDCGRPLIEIMNAAGYQAATLGNHEFDFGLPAAVERATKTCRFPVVACNFWTVPTNRFSGLSRRQVLPAYTVVTAGTSRVAFVGVVTPESITSSTPKNFMDETQSRFLYGFNGGANGKDLYRRVQTAVNAAAREADSVVVLGHMGMGAGPGPWKSSDVIANTTNIVAFLDGHSHTTMITNILNAAGEPVTLAQTGCHLRRLGELRLENGRVVSIGLKKHLGATNATVRALEVALAGRVEAWLGEKLGVVEQKLNRHVCDRETVGETPLGDFVADAFYWYANEHDSVGCDMAFCDYAGIRSDVQAGDFKLRTANDACPFGNGVCLLEMTGAEIREALEWGARRYPGYVGGFLHAAGMRYAVATEVPTSVSSKGGMWTAGPAKGVYRVRDLEVYDRAAKRFAPLDLKKTYRVAGCDYTLMNGGEGYQMLKNCKVIDPCLKTDYVALGEYVKAFRRGSDGWPHVSSQNSPLARLEGYPIDYESPTGAGRIRGLSGL